MNLKKIISVTMAGALALSLAACSAKNEQSAAGSAADGGSLRLSRLGMRRQ